MVEARVLIASSGTWHAGLLVDDIDLPGACWL